MPRELRHQVTLDSGLERRIALRAAAPRRVLPAGEGIPTRQRYDFGGVSLLVAGIVRGVLQRWEGYEEFLAPTPRLAAGFFHIPASTSQVSWNQWFDAVAPLARMSPSSPR